MSTPHYERCLLTNQITTPGYHGNISLAIETSCESIIKERAVSLATLAPSFLAYVVIRH